MDQSRQIRFLIPPFFLLGAVFLADIFSCSNLFDYLKGLDGRQLLAIIAAIVAATIPLGFLVGTVSIGLLHIFSFFMSYFRCTRNWWNYEAVIKKEACEKIWPSLDMEIQSKFNFNKRFYISATFDHDIIPERMSKWIMRRWMAFNTNFNCLTALALAPILCSIFSVEITSKWIKMILLIAIFLTINAAMAWWQVMKMVEFQALRDLKREINGKDSK